MPKYELYRLFEDDKRLPELSDSVQQRIFRLLERVNQPEFVAANNKHAVIFGIDLALLQLGYDLQEKEGEPNGDQSGEVAATETRAEESSARSVSATSKN